MSDTKKVVINRCFGGFGLSEAAYLKLAEYGVPIRAYVEQERGPDGLWLPQPLNEGEVIFDRDFGKRDNLSNAMRTLSGRYWDRWTRESRDHPLVVRVVEELGEAANGPHAELAVVEIPADAEWEISGYDGSEHVAEVHRIWR